MITGNNLKMNYIIERYVIDTLDRWLRWWE